MKYVFLIVTLFQFSMNMFAQTPHWQWAQIGNDGGNGWGNSIAIDPNNNSVYVTGTFTDTLHIGSHSVISAGNTDIFIAKYNSIGQLQWLKRAGGNNEDHGVGIAVDSAGNIYMCSTYYDTAYYDSISFISKGLSDIALTKYDANGNLIWTKAWGSIYYDGWGKICIREDYIYLDGFFAGVGVSPPAHDTIQFDQFALTSHGNQDVFVVKMDTSGTIKWAKSGGGNFEDIANNIDVDLMGNVYISGGFTTSANFDNIHLTEKVGPFGDMFIIKYDSLGNVKWGNGAGGSEPSYALALKSDNNGNVYVGGGSYLSPYISFGSVILSNDKIFIAKYGEQGNLVWAKNVGYQSYDGIFSITLDSANNIITACSYSGQGIFGTDTLNAIGGDILILKLDSNCNHIWSITAGGNNNEEPFDIKMDNFNNIWITGYTNSTPCYFGADQLMSNGTRDFIIAKLSTTTDIPIISNTKDEITLYPNPSSGILDIQIRNKNFTSLKVIDQLGKEVEEQNLKPYQKQIDLHQLPDGVYYLQLKGKGLPVTKKIIIQH